MEALFSVDYRRATWTCFCLGCCYGFSAIEPVNVYSSTLLIKILEVSEGSFPLSVKSGVLIINTANFVGAFLAAIASRYVGRKTILSIGHANMCLCHALVGVFMYFEMFMGVFVMLLVYVITFQMSTGNVSWIYFAEVCVDSGMGIVLAAVQASNILMAFTVSYKIDSPLRFEGTFWLYSGLNVCCLIFLVVFLRETKGLSPSELRHLY